MSDRLHIGIIGCGKISGIYLKNLTGEFADKVRVVALADLVPERAAARAEEFGVGRTCTNEELLADDSIELVVDLTTAPSHAEVNASILRCGKHLYSEKPLALSMDVGRSLIALAEEKGLRVCVAPDTLLGPGFSAAKAALDAGRIGTPAMAFTMCGLPARGESYYTMYRGTLLDLGPYHVGALLRLLGPAVSVSGAAAATPFHPPGSPAHDLDTPGTAAAVLQFAGGAMATLVATGDVSGYLPDLRVWGSEGWLQCADPNMFGGAVTLRRNDAKEAVELPDTLGENLRGIGIADMADAIAAGRPHALGGDFALHTLEVMLAVIDSQRSGRRVSLTTTFEHNA